MKRVLFVIGAIIAMTMIMTPHELSYGATYYVRPSGNDSNNGLTWSTAWRTLDKVNSTVVGGDTVFFGAGRYRGRIVPKSGTVNDRTCFACSSFVEGIASIWASDSIYNWVQHSGNIYKARFPRQAGYFYDDCWTLGQIGNGKDTLLEYVGGISEITSQGKFWYNASTDTLYAWVYGGGDPDNCDMEASMRPVVMFANGEDYNTFWGFKMRYGQVGVVYFHNSAQTDANYNYIQHCHITRVGAPSGTNVGAVEASTGDGSAGSHYCKVTACTLSMAYEWLSGDHIHAYGLGFYSMYETVVESCVVIGGGRNGFAGGINFKRGTHGSVIRFNIIIRPWYYGVNLHHNYDADSVYGNIIIGDGNVPEYGVCLRGLELSESTFVANNTIYRPAYCGLVTGVDDVHTAPNWFKYNIVYGLGAVTSGEGGIVHHYRSSDVSAFTIDSNMYYGQDSLFAVNHTKWTKSQWQSAGNDVRSRFSTNPGFSNPSAYDFSRPSSSQEINVTYGGRTWTRYGAWQPPAGPDTTRPVISNVRATDTTTTSATIAWTTNEPATTQIDYGLTTSYGSSTSLVSTLVTAHSQAITGLTPSTTYHYRVRSRDAAGNEAVSGDFTFRTKDPDVTPPTITNVTATNIGTNTATITWTTNEAATSQVEYGFTTSYGFSTAFDSALVTSHSVNLSGLQADTVYHYRVRSRDAAGNLATSGDYTFRTQRADVTPPTISNVTATNITASSVTITWTTNEAATSQVNYGLTTTYGNSTALDPTLVLNHTVNISGLTADTLYHFRVRSRDGSGNEATSGDYTFRTLASSGLQNLSQGISATVSSTYPGYSPARITDGVINPRGGTSTTWASNSSSTQPHWVQIDFGAPKRVQRMVVYWAWNAYLSNWMCSRQYRIQYWLDNAFVDAATVSNTVAESVTVTDFPPVVTTRVRYYQPANMGPTGYSTVVWVTEMQFFGGEPPDTIPPAAPTDLRGIPGAGHGSIKLRWTAPSDSGSQLGRYEVRYAPAGTGTFDWSTATLVEDQLPSPAPAGTPESCVVSSGLEPGCRYLVAMRVFDAIGNPSPLSPVIDTFASGVAPPTPLGTVPDNPNRRAAAIARRVHTYLPVYYEFAADSAPSFSHQVITPGQLLSDTATIAVFENLRPNVRYYWRCRARSNSPADSSEWSDTLSFVLSPVAVNDLLTAADCIYPADGAVVPSARPVFSVRRVDGLESMFIEVDDDPQFGSPLSSGSLPVGTESIVNWQCNEPLQEGTSYYWRVSADSLSWTDRLHFTVALKIHAYPNPFRVEQGHTGVTFVNLPRNSKITITTLSGTLVYSISGVGPDQWTWDVRNGSGKEVAPGVYLYTVEFPNGTSEGKIMVMR